MESLAHSDLGAAWSEAAVLRPGMTLGRYELLVPVGSGGMASVWAARLRGHGGFSKLVAIKTVLPHLANQRELQTMLFDEARIAAHAHHPNVCKVLDVGEDSGVTYAVLEWIDGDSLLRLVRSGGVPIEHAVAARIVADACAGLHAAHELQDEAGLLLGVVHRDVSPHNLLISVDGTTKIADFGVAKARGQLHQATRAGELRGKVAYMAPEQITSADIDRRADVFSLGCVLYFATTGHAPFRGENDVQVIRAVIEGRFDLPSRLATWYPTKLAAIVLKAMAPAPADRYDTADAMRLALDSWISASGRPASSSNVADIVHERIGPKLTRRREQVRMAIHASRETGTRPVRLSLPPESGVTSAVHRALPAAGADGGKELAQRITPIPPAERLSTTPVAVSHAPAPRARGTKMMIAVAVGLLSAGALIFARSTGFPHSGAVSLPKQALRDPSAAVLAETSPAVRQAPLMAAAPAGAALLPQARAVVLAAVPVGAQSAGATWQVAPASPPSPAQAEPAPVAAQPASAQATAPSVVGAVAKERAVSPRPAARPAVPAASNPIRPTGSVPPSQNGGYVSAGPKNAPALRGAPPVPGAPKPNEIPLNPY